MQPPFDTVLHNTTSYTRKDQMAKPVFAHYPHPDKEGAKSSREVPKDQDLTMYGYGRMTELKKDTLGRGDVIGVQFIYKS
jgi:hypothetical protein